MSFDADLTACATLVERADPWRFRAVMAAPLAARRQLFALYAFNVEVARAPWVTQEPMIAEMRLQWWRDVCEQIAKGEVVRRHEVATPLASVLTPPRAQLLDELVAARRWDIYKDAFEDAAHFARYIDQTAGHLAWVAASTLGQADEQVVRDAAFAAGIAAWLRAIPELEARGRIPLLDGTNEGVVTLAKDALARLAKARARRSTISRAARPALMHVGPAAAILSAAVKDPGAVIEGQLPDPVDGDRFGLAFRAITGRW
ncbi:squalene/phytoene synthase family protein [Sulfitobacter geojensis]|uniref:squalene/phytoene synthase family protein n=1 Tax=Sulfitobacter geojensis TaxID=1342299 RepID=UPI000468D800|nr:squalene/phytoene synthase family protein [Sulfitobacter geojensis]KHA52625.1 Phytoene/squalene synthetase [Sulfitobacter geojensis]NYI28699.1 phytoene/squalene synthetase [Sulfitobacter geojensis]